MRRYGFLFIVGTLAVLLLSPSTALGCSCTGAIPFDEAMGHSRATFVGEVLSVRFKASWAYRAQIRVREVWAQLTGNPDPSLLDWYGSPLYGRVVSIRLIEGFKGTLAPTIDVHMGESAQDACDGYPFEPGSRYLVFAYAGKNDRLEVTGCGMTRPIGEVGDAIVKLRALAASGAS